MRDDWTECKLEDLLAYRQPSKYIVKSTLYCNSYKTPVLTAGKSFIIGKTNEKDGIFSDVPVIIFDDFTTATQYVNFPFKVKSSAMKILLPTSPLVNLKWVFYYMQTIRENTDTHKRYWISMFSQIPIPFPHGPEQRAIVAKIEQLFSDLDNGIANLKEAKEKLSIYRQSVLKKAFEGELTREWRSKQTDLPTGDELLQQIKEERRRHYNQQLEEWKQAVKEWEESGKGGKKPGKPKKPADITDVEKEVICGLPCIPKVWKWTKWETILTYGSESFKRGPFGSALKKAYFVNSGFKVYEQYCPINDDCSFERYYISAEKFEELKKFAVAPGDFLVSCSGVTLGRITQVQESDKPGIINQALLRLRINAKAYSTSFFKTFFRSPYFQDKIFENSTGSAIPNIKGVKELKAIPVPMLSLQEQNQIVQEIESRLSVCDKLEESIENSLKQAEALRQSILKRAFEGKLLTEAELTACRQEPDWEPAEKLLEKIKAER